MAVNYFRFSFPQIPDVVCAFQFKSSPPPFSEESMGGNISWLARDDAANVRQTRRELLAELAEEGLAEFCECRQAHGKRLLADADLAPGASVPADLPEADGMATAVPGVGLLIKTADCQPVLVAHKSGRHIMALHVGWRGNRLGFIMSAIKDFCLGNNLAPADLAAARGPSLGPANAQFTNFDKEWGESFLPWFDKESQTMNLWELTKWQLRQAGLLPENIYGLDICTFANCDRFFSYRKNRHTGRQGSIIWIKKKWAG